MKDLALNPLIQGVNFALSIPGARLRVFVDANVLRSCFGAGPLPGEWLACVRQEAALLRSVATLLHRESGANPVVITLSAMARPEVQALRLAPAVAPLDPGTPATRAGQAGPTGAATDPVTASATAGSASNVARRASST